METKSTKELLFYKEFYNKMYRRFLKCRNRQTEEDIETELGQWKFQVYKAFLWNILLKSVM